MATTTKKATPIYRVEEALYASLGAVERAGKEITHLAHEGRKRIKTYERKAVVPAKKAPRKA